MQRCNMQNVLVTSSCWGRFLATILVTGADVTTTKALLTQTACTTMIYTFSLKN